MKLKLYSLSLVACVGFSSISQAQNTPSKIIPCYTDEHFAEMAKENPALLQQRELAEKQLFTEAERMLATKKSNGNMRTQSTPRIIPVVFHVIHKGGSENITLEQIKDQIRILNEDYSLSNGDTSRIPAAFWPIIGQPNIEFRLAQIDPNGNCTEGVTRTYNNMTDGTVRRDDVKSIIQWPSNKYLNIWVVRSISSSTLSGGGTILGYAQFPGMGSASTDGVVVIHDNIGSIGTAVGGGRVGRTATHEVGHWLGLRHIWGDVSFPTTGSCGNDFVSDTPPAEDANYGCLGPVGVNGKYTTYKAFNNCGSDARGEMTFNYMDYSDDVCMSAFSAGQVAVFDATLGSSISGRNNLISNANLIATGVLNAISPCAPIADFYPQPYKVICQGENIIYTDRSYNGVETGRTWNFTGGLPTTSIDSIDTVTYNTPGVYDVDLTATNGQGSSTVTRTGRVLVLDNTGTGKYPAIGYTEGFESLTTFNQDWFVANYDNDAIKFTTTNLSAYTGARSLYINNFNNKDKLIEELYSPSFDFTNVTAPQLKFRLFYAAKSTTSDDNLKIYSSTNCANFATAPRYNKIANGSGSNNLNTVTSLYPNNSKTPGIGSTEWRQETISSSIASVAGKANVRFKFVFTCGAGNNIFIDDINITGTATVGIENVDIANLELDVYPNPITDNTQLSFNLIKQNDVNVYLTDMLGKNVGYVFNGTLTTGEHTYPVNTAKLQSGIYLLNVEIGGVKTVRKLVKE